MNPSRFLLPSALALAPLACVLPDLDLEGRACPCTDGYVCDEATNTCVGELPSGGNGTGAGPQAGGGGSGAGEEGGGGGGVGASGGGGTQPGVGLVFTEEDDDHLWFEVAGRFRLGTDPGDQFQLSHWYDLGTEPELDLAENNISSPHLYEPWAYTDGAQWYGAENAGAASYDIDDETPLRATLTSYLSMPYGLEIESQYTVYASGRVVIYTTASNGTAAAVYLEDSEFHHTTVSELVGWDDQDLSGSGALFARTDGSLPHPTLLTVNLGTATGLFSDFPQNRYWHHGQLFVDVGDTIIKVGELVVYPATSAAEGLERIDDLRSPSVITQSGAEFDGWDEERGSYVFDVTGSPVQVGVTTDLARYAPVFELNEWTSPTFQISRDGVVLATNEQPIGSEVVAHYDAEDQELKFTFMGKIAQGAPDSERLFEVVP